MSTDAQFLAAIAAAPLDSLPKLVYADWLDERDDPRGELLRLDHTLSHTPPSSDRYRELREKRELLAASVADDWLTAVGVGADASPLLSHGWPDDVDGRWRVIGAAIERWTGHPPPDVALGWAAFFTTPQQSDRLNPFPDAGPPDQQHDPDFVWLLPNPTDESVFWCVRRSDEGRRDPPVWRCRTTEPTLPPVGFATEESEPAWPSASLFVLHELLRRTHCTGGFVSAEMIDSDELQAELRPHLVAAVPFGPLTVYERNGIVAVIRPGREWPELSVSVRANAVSHIPEVLFGVWGYDQGELSGVFIPEPLRPATEPGAMPARLGRSHIAYLANRRGEDVFDRDGKAVPDADAVPWFRMAGCLGRASSCTTLAAIYLRDNGVVPDPAESLAWRERGAWMGDGHAQYTLGLMYSHGLHGVSKDLQKAEKWLTRSIPGMGGEALDRLAELYEEQDDLIRAADHLRQAAEAGKPGAQCRWAEWLLEGKGCEPDPVAALKWYEQAAEQGDAVAAHQIGYVRAQGSEELRDPAESERWYRIAAEKDVPEACLNLGLNFQGRHGYRTDHDEQAKWYLRAGELGHPNGYYNLACMYQQGDGRPVDFAKAIEYFRKGDKLGDLDSAEALGNVYSSGEYDQKDDAEAVRWYRKAAEGGLATAQH